MVNHRQGVPCRWGVGRCALCRVTVVSFAFAALQARRHARTVRYVNDRVGKILDHIAEHEAKRRQWEAELAELERTRRAEVEAAKRGYEEAHSVEADKEGGDDESARDAQGDDDDRNHGKSQ